MSRQSYEGVAVAVPVSIPYQRYSTSNAHWFIGQALQELVKKSGIAKGEIDGLTISSFSLGPDTAVGMTQHFGLTPRWLDHIPTGGASGVMALRRAARAVQAGDANVVACVAADTNQVDSFRLMLGNFSNFARDATYPYGSGGPNALFAFITSHYMRKYGATREDFGRICIDQRFNALAYGSRMFTKSLNLDQYMASRPIADPIHLFDCVMPCAGAEAFLVMSEERARDSGLAYANIRGAIERHNAFNEDPIMDRGGWLIDRDELPGRTLSAELARTLCDRHRGIGADGALVVTHDAATREGIIKFSSISRNSFSSYSRKCHKKQAAGTGWCSCLDDEQTGGDWQLHWRHPGT